jgi:hypothetical protein
MAGVWSAALAHPLTAVPLKYCCCLLHPSLRVHAALNDSAWRLLAVLQVDGDWRYDSRRSSMLWTIDLVDDQNRSGSMEFVVRVQASVAVAQTPFHEMIAGSSFRAYTCLHAQCLGGAAIHRQCRCPVHLHSIYMSCLTACNAGTGMRSQHLLPCRMQLHRHKNTLRYPGAMRDADEFY